MCPALCAVVSCRLQLHPHVSTQFSSDCYASCLQLVAEFSRGWVPKVLKGPGKPKDLTWHYSGPKADESELPVVFDMSGLERFQDFLEEEGNTFK